MPLRRLALLAVPVAALLLAGCSDGSADGEPGAAASSASSPRAGTTSGASESVRAGLVRLWAGDASDPRTERTGACFADAVLARFSRDELVAAGVVGDDGAVVDTLPPLGEAAARRWVDAQFACTDFVEASTRALAAQARGRLDKQQYAACLRRRVSDAQLREAVAATLTGEFQAPEVGRLSRAQAACAERARSSG